MKYVSIFQASSLKFSESNNFALSIPFRFEFWAKLIRLGYTQSSKLRLIADGFNPSTLIYRHPFNFLSTRVISQCKYVLRKLWLTCAKNSKLHISRGRPVFLLHQFQLFYHCNLCEILPTITWISEKDDKLILRKKRKYANITSK